MRILVVALILLVVNAAHGQKGYPAPTSRKNLLFYIQHDRGQNTYVYKANLTKSRSFVKDEPIVVYRQLFEEGGQTKPLTKIQKLFAYGIKSDLVGPNAYEAHIVSLPNQKINVKLNPDKTPVAETSVNGKKLVLERIFLKLTEGTSGMGTKLDYIIFFGKDKNGQPVEEKLVM